MSTFNTKERDRLCVPVQPRGQEAAARLFDGMELVAPGIAPITDWHNDTPPGERPPVCDVGIYGAAARTS